MEHQLISLEMSLCDHFRFGRVEYKPTRLSGCSDPPSSAAGDTSTHLSRRESPGQTTSHWQMTTSRHDRWQLIQISSTLFCDLETSQKIRNQPALEDPETDLHASILSWPHCCYHLRICLELKSINWLQTVQNSAEMCLSPCFVLFFFVTLHRLPECFWINLKDCAGYFYTSPWHCPGLHFAKPLYHACDVWERNRFCVILLIFWWFEDTKCCYRDMIILTWVLHQFCEDKTFLY